jgi:hypothetical protein
VQGTGTAVLGGVVGMDLEAEQSEDGGHGDGGTDSGEVDGRVGDDGWTGRRVVLGLAQQLAAFAGLGELAIAVGQDVLVAAVELVLRGDIADGAVQADMVVMGDVIGDDAACVVEGEGDLDADAIALDGFVPTFDFAVGLGIVG